MAIAAASMTYWTDRPARMIAVIAGKNHGDAFVQPAFGNDRQGRDSAGCHHHRQQRGIPKNHAGHRPDAKPAFTTITGHDGRRACDQAGWQAGIWPLGVVIGGLFGLASQGLSTGWAAANVAPVVAARLRDWRLASCQHVQCDE